MKFIMKDASGEEFEVSEVLEDDAPVTEEEIHDEGEQLTAEEIAALKSLASVADKLIALTQTTDSDEEEEKVEDEDEEEEKVDDEDEEDDSVKDEDEEQIIDTDEEKDDKIKDSIGSLQKKTKTKDSSEDARQLEIAATWSKNYKEVK